MCIRCHAAKQWPLFRRRIRRFDALLDRTDRRIVASNIVDVLTVHAAQAHDVFDVHADAADAVLFVAVITGHD